MSIDYTVGDQVVCVDVAPRNKQSFNAPEHLAQLTVGNVYVAKVVRYHPTDRDIILVGMEGINTPNGVPYGFHGNRFRKVQKTYSGMKILTGLLIQKPETVGV